MKPIRISLVYANWCPHCYPISVDATKKMSKELGVPIRLLDIEKQDDVQIGDDLVKRHGDDASDYLIPQVFLEYLDGNVQHIFTGFSESPEVTKMHWNHFFSSHFYRSLKSS